MVNTQSSTCFIPMPSFFISYWWGNQPRTQFSFHKSIHFLYILIHIKKCSSVRTIHTVLIGGWFYLSHLADQVDSHTQPPMNCYKVKFDTHSIIAIDWKYQKRAYFLKWTLQYKRSKTHVGPLYFLTPHNIEWIGDYED